MLAEEFRLAKEHPKIDWNNVTDLELDVKQKVRIFSDGIENGGGTSQERLAHKKLIEEARKQWMRIGGKSIAKAENYVRMNLTGEFRASCRAQHDTDSDGEDGAVKEIVRTLLISQAHRDWGSLDDGI